MIGSLTSPFEKKFGKWVSRRHPAAAGAHYLSAKNIYIFPSRAGIGFFVLLLLLLLGSINYANNLGYFMTFWLGGLYVVGMLVSYRNMIGLTITITAGEPTFNGLPATFDVHLKSSDNRPKYDITIKHDDFHVLIESIQASDQTTASIIVDTHKRGILPLRPLKLFSTSPFGLFQAWTYANIKASVLVYPEPLTTGFPGLVDAAANSVEAHRNQTLEGDQFEQLKKYEKGESLSRVAWKLVARNQGMYSKQFTQSALPEVILDWQAIAGDVEEKLSKLTYLVCECAKTHTKFGLHLPGQHIDIGQGPGHMAKCLERLALFGTDHSGS